MKVTSAAVYARGMRCIEASPERVDPLCPVYGKCGGCDFRHCTYAEELRSKKQRVTDALQRIAGADLEVEDIYGSEKTEEYRNKVIYSFGELNGKPVAGFYRSRTHEVIPVARCLLQPELADRAATAVCHWAQKEKISVYDSLKAKGLLRHVFVRGAVKTNDAVVCVVSAGGFGTATGKLVDALRAACPELTGIVLCVNKTKGNTVLAGDLHTLWGRAEITDDLCGIEYEISPFAFFQINPPQAERLYQKALEFAEPTADDTVLDLYCGAGTITLCLAQKAGKVIGAEIVPEAIENARLNAERNGIRNAEFLCADASDAARIFRERGITPKVIVVDPPRKGLAEDVVDTMAAMSPERIVYVSCDPATMARDVKRFISHGYHLRRAVAFDLFPRCAHVESVVLLSKAPEFCFRLAREEDAQQVLSLYENARSEEFCVWDESYPTMTEIDHDLETDNLYVLTDGDRVIGAISVVPENEMDEFDCWTCKDGREIARNVIDKAYHGRGLSFENVKVVESILLKSGCKAIRLSVAKCNIPAYKTYIKAGFTKAGEADMYGSSYYLMEKILEV